MNAHASNTIHVVQGQYRISASPEDRLATVLGSCIATCIFDEQFGVGGMNHFLVPGEANAHDGNLKYGVNAMELLINGILQKGASREHLRAKVFGGAKLFAGRHAVGEANARFALWYLEAENIPVVSRCIGGNQGRKVRFHPYTGQAQRMFLSDIPSETIPSKSASRQHAPKANEAVGALTLF